MARRHHPPPHGYEPRKKPSDEVLKELFKIILLVYDRDYRYCDRYESVQNDPFKKFDHCYSGIAHFMNTKLSEKWPNDNWRVTVGRPDHNNIVTTVTNLKKQVNIFWTNSSQQAFNMLVKIDVEGNF